MRLNQPIYLGGYAIVGVDDWLVFARDLGHGGSWVFWHTECDRAWNWIACATGRNDAGLGDDPAVEVAAVGLLMAIRGESPRRIFVGDSMGTDAGTIADLERNFGFSNVEDFT